MRFPAICLLFKKDSRDNRKKLATRAKKDGISQIEEDSDDLSGASIDQCNICYLLKSYRRGKAF